MKPLTTKATKVHEGKLCDQKISCYFVVVAGLCVASPLEFYLSIRKRGGASPRRTAEGGCPYAKPLRRPVKLPVHIDIPQDGLDVFAGFGEGDGLDELLRIAVVALSQPVSHAVGAGIVGG